jgi:LPS sulfotransferase NodH
MTAKDRPIFLVGCPRSGTTLLSAILHAHPRIAMPPETRFLLPVYRERLQFGDLTVEENRRRLAERMTGRGTRFRDLGLRRKDVIEKIVAGPPTVGSAAGTIWREFAYSRGKARWGEKRPAYWRDMALILRLFPEAQVIHLVRDGRACAASLKQVHWWRSGVPGAIAAWVLADRELRRAGRRLPADSYYRLRYEDLLADPRTELGALCEFLGEDFDAAMLDHASAAQDIVPARKSWHVRTKGELDPARIDAWRTVLTPREIGLFEQVAAAPLRRNGYELSGSGSPPGPRLRLDYRLALARSASTMYKEWLVDAQRRARHPQPLADLG